MTFHRVRRPMLLDDGTVKEEAEPKLVELMRRVRHLVAVDDRRAMVDGYATSTPLNGSPGGGKGGGRVMVIEDEHGDPDPVPTTSTESAALTVNRLQCDPVHDLKVEALRHYHRAVVALEELDATLGRFDRLRMASKVPDPPQCYVISKMLGLPWDERWQPWRATAFPKLADRFDEPRQVCQWVYWFARDNHRLPTAVEALKYLERDTVARQAGRR
jgi:hypothetical protein